MAKRNKPKLASSSRASAPFDGTAFGQELVKIVRGFMRRQTASLEERLAAVEAQIAEMEAKQ